MRVHFKEDNNAGHFSKLILNIEDGKYPESEEKVILPPGIDTVISILKDLIEKVNFDIENLKNKTINYLCERAIFT